MKNRDPDDPLTRALARYQVIAAYIAESPSRGAGRALLDKLAARSWTGPDGQPLVVSAETIRAWIRRYRTGGLDGLKDKPRAGEGVQVLDADTIELICRLKREVPERSLDRLIRIIEEMQLVPVGRVRRSTLHRVLADAGISRRKTQTPDNHDLDRFEAAAPNDLWQSDMLEGPWMPDPARPGHVRKSWLYAFLDDHSRRLLHGRFSFKGDLPALEMVFRRSLQKCGVPRRVYYDNGQVYRSHHMAAIVAEIGAEGMVFTKVRRPMGHGKIEALNRLVTSAFIAEVKKASTITTLDELNEAFVAWMDLVYNETVHGETHQTPLARWSAGLGSVRLVDEEKLRKAFLWRETRKPDKAGVFSLVGRSSRSGPRSRGAPSRSATIPMTPTRSRSGTTGSSRSGSSRSTSRPTGGRRRRATNTRAGRRIPSRQRRRWRTTSAIWSRSGASRSMAASAARGRSRRTTRPVASPRTRP